ncbi:MAG: DnaJ domain-containing protein [Chloroflexi bacterium]|nr:DnaJ domain-containing protein [Chloroflexota bacterium]
MRRKIIYDPNNDYYDILDASANASEEELRVAYRRAVREVHPDLNPHRSDWATAQLQRVNEAYGVLGDAAKRKEYDRVRWPHMPTQPPGKRPSYRSPFSAPGYDPDRPWWEQASPNRTKGSFSSHAASRFARQQATVQQPAPYWLRVSAWLRAHKLGWLESTWLTLVGLWRSPYAGLLIFLSIILALNVALIIFVFFSPDIGGGWDLRVFEWDSWGTGDEFTAEDFPTPTLVLVPTAEPLQLECPEDVMINEPGALETVSETFPVHGTITPEASNFSLHLAYLGSDALDGVVAPDWVLVPTVAVESEQFQSEDPVQLTASDIDMQGRETGHYVIRLQVQLQGNSADIVCDRRISWEG